MITEVISERDDLVIRRMILQPGEATFWHTDNCHRFSLVVQGSQLRIEYRDSAETALLDVHPGTAAWDRPEPEVHRAVNTGLGLEGVDRFYQSSGHEFEP